MARSKLPVGGRPRKPADPKFPNRVESVLARQRETSNAGNTTENPTDGGERNQSERFDERPIVIDSERTNYEENTAASIAEDESGFEETKPIGDDYYCLECEIPIVVSDKECPGCGNKLDWEAVHG